jgi:hypothetical protein
MKRIKRNRIKYGIIIGILALIIIALVVVSIKIFSKGSIIVYESYYFEMGSETIRIYSTGLVEADSEIENPNHKINFKKVKDLSKDELEELKEKIKSKQGDDDESFKRYVYKLVYDIEIE